MAPDPKYGNVLDRPLHQLHGDEGSGKKSTAERIVYGAIALMEQKSGQDGLSGHAHHVMNNVKPNLEAKAATSWCHLPGAVEIKPERRNARHSWLISFASSRPDKTMAEAARGRDAHRHQERRRRGQAGRYIVWRAEPRLRALSLVGAAISWSERH
ncbi:MAG: hypothetical protein U0527_07535 [Candidatus Eisenbacteria bacterium]